MMWLKIFSGIFALMAAVLWQFETETDLHLLSKAVVVAVNKSEAFKFISNMDNFAMWYPGTIHHESTDSGMMGIGKRYRETLRIPFVGDVDYDNIVTGFDPPNFLSLTIDTWLRSRVEIHLSTYQGKATHCKITWRLYSRRRNYFFRFFLAPIVRFFYNQRTKQAMFNLRFMPDMIDKAKRKQQS